MAELADAHDLGSCGATRGANENYVLTENSEEEISKAVLEYMDFLSNDDLPLTSKQKKYIEYVKKQGYCLLSNRTSFSKTHNDEDEMVERYKAATLLEKTQGTLCAGFLEEHW